MPMINVSALALMAPTSEEAPYKFHVRCWLQDLGTTGDRHQNPMARSLYLK